jgi:hypothetical protein
MTLSGVSLLNDPTVITGNCRKDNVIVTDNSLTSICRKQKVAVPRTTVMRSEVRKKSDTGEHTERGFASAGELPFDKKVGEIDLLIVRTLPQVQFGNILHGKHLLAKQGRSSPVNRYILKHSTLPLLFVILSGL